MQQILQQAERTGPAADYAASGASDQSEKTKQVKRYMVCTVGCKQLQRSNRAGKQRRRAGVAVKAGAGQHLQAALINAAGIKAVEIAVK